MGPYNPYLANPDLDPRFNSGYVSNSYKVNSNNGMIDALISGGANVISSVVGGIFANKAQKSANQTNIQLQREQQAYNKQMWDLNNAYNSPLAQRQRMEEAGYNPFMAFNQGTTGNATSQVQAVAPAQVQPENGAAIAATGIGNSISNAVHDYYNYQAQSEAIESQRIENRNKQRLFDLEFAIKSRDANLKDQVIKTQKLENYYLENSLQDRLNAVNLENQLRRETMASIIVSRAGQLIDNKIKQYSLDNVLPVQVDQMKQGIEESMARIIAMRQHSYNETRSTNAQINLMSYQAANLAMQTEFGYLNMEQQKKMFPFLLNTAKQGFENLKKQGLILDQQKVGMELNNRFLQDSYDDRLKHIKLANFGMRQENFGKFLRNTRDFFTLPADIASSNVRAVGDIFSFGLFNGFKTPKVNSSYGYSSSSSNGYHYRY